MKKYVKSSKQGAPDVRSYVYNALSDVAFELTQNGYDVNKAEFKKATDNFMHKFFAEDASLEHRVSAATKLDGEDPLQAALDAFQTGHQVCIRDDFSSDEDYEEYLSYIDMGPSGFYDEFKDELDFDEMFVEEYGNGHYGDGIF